MVKQTKAEKLISLNEPVVNIYKNIEGEMLENIGKQLSKNVDLLDTDPAAWKLKQLQNMGLLDQDNIRTIRKNAKLTNDQINQALIQSGVDGVNLTDKAAQAAVKKNAPLVKPTPITGSDKLLEILKSYQNKAKNIANLTNQKLIPQGNQAYLDIINNAVTKVSTGRIDGLSALRSSVSQLTEKGLTIVRDSAGRERGLEGYIRSVMVTTANNVVNEMQDQRIEEWGIGLVEISSHSGNRPGCVPYAGRIFSLKTGHPKYPYLYDPAVGRIGAADSLFGVNCGHIKYPFVEGVSVQRNFPNDPKKNKEDYAEQQKQRGYERAIRRAKTREKVLEGMGDKKGAAQARQLVKSRQKNMRKFIDKSGRTRRYGREGVWGDKLAGPNPKPVKLPDTIPPAPKKPVKKVTPKPKPVTKPKAKLEQMPAFKPATQSEVKDIQKAVNKPKSKVSSISKPSDAKSLTSSIPKMKEEALNIGKHKKLFWNKKSEMSAEFEYHNLLTYKKYKAIGFKQYDLNGIDLDNVYANMLGTKTATKATKAQVAGQHSQAALDEFEKKKDAISKIGKHSMVNINKKTLEIAVEVDKPSLTLYKQYKAIGVKMLDGYGKDKSNVFEKIINSKALATPKAKSNPATKVFNDNIDEDLFDVSKYKVIDDNSPDVLRGNNLAKNIPGQDRDVIKRYTGSGYDDMNSHLRFDNVDNPKVTRETDTLKKAINKRALPFKEDVVLYRKTGNNSVPELFGMDVELLFEDAMKSGDASDIAKKLANATVKDEAFTSASYRDDVFTKYEGVTMEIMIPKGYKNGLFIEEISGFGKSESEYLINAGQKYRVLGVRVGEVFNPGRNSKAKNLIVQLAPIN